MSSIGPHIPDNLPTNDAQESDEDDYTPALPPELAAARKAGPPAPPSRVLGPTFPTAPDPDSDDDVGPQPLPAHVRPPSPSAVDDFLAHEARRRQNALAASNPKPVRDAWMLVPPTRASASADPSRRGPRQFARTARAGDVDSSLWTETPAERQQRLADEVAGRKRPAGAPPRDAGADADADAGADGARKRRRDAEIRRGVEQHTRAVRGPALVDVHVEPKKDDGDGPSALWDHTRDMALGGRLMDDTQRQKLLREAKGLGDRFGTGKSGGFL